MVGRETELRRSGMPGERVGDRARCQLFTILGVGRRRQVALVAEFLASLDGARSSAAAACPTARASPTGRWSRCSSSSTRCRRPTRRPPPRSARCSATERGVTSAEEIAWAFRKLLEAVAAERRSSVVFDDLHWGEETFLDLVEHVADPLPRRADPAPLHGAPELLDRRRLGRRQGQRDHRAARAARRTETDELIERLAHLDDDAARARILDAAEGNPLFVEEMVALRASRTAARSRCRRRSRRCSPPASTSSSRPSATCSSAARSRARSSIAAPSRRSPRGAAGDGAAGGARPQGARSAPTARSSPGEDAFRFRHLLIRDAAYDALPKATRADLHERFAAWLERARHAISSSWTRSSATTSSRRRATATSSASRTRRSPNGRATGLPPPVGRALSRDDRRAAASSDRAGPRAQPADKPRHRPRGRSGRCARLRRSTAGGGDRCRGSRRRARAAGDEAGEAHAERRLRPLPRLGR